MKILLFGEYSGFFNHLKSGLLELGHDVTHAARADGFKNYNVDINLEARVLDSTFWLTLRKIIYKIFEYDVAGLQVLRNFKKNKHRFTGYDVVFLINPFPLQTHPKLEKQILEHLFENNSKVFLSACGDDYHYINFLQSADLNYSILDPIRKDASKRQYFRDSLKYLKSSQKELHDYVLSRCKGVISANIDYAMAYENTPKYLGYAPFPFKAKYLHGKVKESDDKIYIFHGINTYNYYKKGNDIFKKALDLIEARYPEKIKIFETENLSYKAYVKAMANADIVLDQVYSYSQGYNALEAMSQGKVVFSGAEDEWLKFFSVEKDTVVINTLPDATYIASKLEQLITDKAKMSAIKSKAKAFVETNHNAKQQAEAYVKLWNG